MAGKEIERQEIVPTVNLQQELNDLAKLVSLICDATFVTISLRNNGVNLKSHFGLEHTGLTFDDPFYTAVQEHRSKLFYVEDLRNDIRFKTSSLLQVQPALLSYWGCPVLDENMIPKGVISIFHKEIKLPKTVQKEALSLLTAQFARLIEKSQQIANTNKHLEDTKDTVRHVVACTNSGVWRLNLETNDLVLNEEWANLLGYTLNELLPANFDTWKNLVHPEDYTAASDKLGRYVSGKAETYDVEFRMLHKNGWWKWIRSKGMFTSFAPNGTPLILFGTHTDIHEKKKNEITLANEKERLALASKATSEIIWDWDIEQNTIFLGANYKSFFGFDPLTNVDAYFEDWRKRVHPDDLDVVVRNMDAALESDTELFVNDYRFKKQDGSFAHIVDNAFIVRNAEGRAVRMVGSFQDMTARKEVELQLKVFESIINKTKDPIIITKVEPLVGPLGPEIIYVNEALVKLSEYAKEELIGKTPRIFQGPNSDPATIKKISQSLRTSKTIEVDILNYSKSNKEYWVNLSIFPIVDENGLDRYMIAVQKDITERKKNESKLKELNGKLQKKASELQALNDELEQFAYITSHDLQEPLRMVTSFLTQLERKYSNVLDERGRKYVYFAVDGAKRMRQLILDLLDYSRVGKLNEQVEDVNLNILMADVVELSDRMIKEKKAILTIEELPKVKSLYSLLRQVFLNLINNALTYCDDAKTPEISVSAQETEDAFQITVADNGIGIKEEYLEKIFVIFQRLHTKDEYAGTGIGLSIAKKVMDHLGGKIWVESVEGNGSKFTIELKKY